MGDAGDIVDGTAGAQRFLFGQDSASAMMYRMQTVSKRWVYLLSAAAWLCAVTVLAGCVISSPSGDTTIVQRVIDGDTVELSDGRKVRYIGVDTPEVRQRNRQGGWVKKPEPYAEEATAFNRQLVEGKAVRLEQDVQSHDRYGRLLSYVYVGEFFVNAELVKQGYAVPLTIPPNVKHAELFRDMAREARQEQRGLWSIRE